MKSIEKKNFLWSTIGSLIFGFTSLFFMIITTRINGVDIAGSYAYAFAIACTLCTIGSYAGKVFQVTETNSDISDCDYIYNHLFTCFIMIIFSVLFCIVTRPNMLKVMLIIILTLYRSVDVMIDSLHAIIQRNGELYKVGVSMFIRTIVLVLIFTVIDYFTNSIIISCSALVILNILFCLFVDLNNAKRFIKKNSFNNKNNIYLLKSGFTLFCYSFLSVYVINMPKYSIEYYSTNEVQAIFGIIIMPASFLALASNYIIQPFLNKITEYIKNDDNLLLIKLIKKLILSIVLIGILAIIVCYFIGIPILQLVYGISLESQRNNLIIILIGSIFYSIVILISSVYVAMRKNNMQLILLIVTSVFAVICSFMLTNRYNLLGASLSYSIIMIFQFIAYIITFRFYMKGKKKMITIRMMGGLGNQMFQYAALRSMMLKYGQDGSICLKGITNKTHNIYSLNHFAIDESIKIANNENLKSYINYLIYGFYCLFLVKKENGFKVMERIQPIINKLGMYCVPDGYIKISKFNRKNNVMIGYYQSTKYFDEYKDIIKKELKVKEKIDEKNIEIFNDIKDSNSICVHIRRGDYVGTNHQVCDNNYYYEAMSLMDKKIENAKFFIFSDDIDWVKNNMSFDKNVVFVEGKNVNYEELRLMYTCKHFIISNSSFSWWAQYLTDNKERITIAPSKWFQNPNQKVDIFEKDWIRI